MDINNRIREQVKTDLAAAMLTEDGSSLIKTFHNGVPFFLEVADPSDAYAEGDIPALSVSLSEGTPTSDDFSENTWQATMTVRLYQQASNLIEQSLDELGQVVIETLGTHYDASGLLETCNRSGFDYGRDDEQPWGTLDLYFSVQYTEE